MSVWGADPRVTRVSDEGDSAEFVRLLRSRDRKPVVAVSIRVGRTVPDLDLGALIDELGDSVIVAVLEPEATFRLTDELGSKSRSVHSGWVRVYPALADWMTGASKAPSFAPIPAHPRRLLARVVEAALQILYVEAPPVTVQTGMISEVVQVSVSGVLSATQVLVEDDRRRQAVMWSHHLVPGIHADRLVRPGQRLDGCISSEGLLGAFTPAAVAEDPTARCEQFIGEGVVTLAQVAKADPDSATLLLHPRFPLDLSGEEGQDLTVLIREGDTVVVEIVPIDGSLEVAFSDEEPGPSVSVLPDGPPWLVEEPSQLPEDDESQEPEVDEILDAVDPEGVALLEEALEVAQRRIELLEDEAAQLRRSLRSATKLSVPRVYSDEEQQFRFEIDLAYLTVVPESDRDRWPLQSSFEVGPGFIESVRALVADGGIKRDKIVDVCAQVLCGQAREVAARAVREWKASRRGPQEIRKIDGAAAWRVNLQTNTASARRLKVWQLADGRMELDSVGVHDDGLSG